MILIVGLPKSGTTSFTKLFSNAGYNTVHWKISQGYIGKIIQQNKINNKPLLTGLTKFDCITQMDVCIDHDHAYWPQVSDYKDLYYQNPDAIFILNKRDPSKVLSSFKRWKKYDKRYDKRLFTYNPELINDKTDSGFINFVKDHYNNIETFFSSNPEAKFIIFDIEEDSVEKLEKYIDLKGQKVFPRCNVNWDKEK